VSAAVLAWTAARSALSPSKTTKPLLATAASNAALALPAARPKRSLCNRGRKDEKADWKNLFQSAFLFFAAGDSAAGISGVFHPGVMV